MSERSFKSSKLTVTWLAWLSFPARDFRLSEFSMENSGRYAKALVWSNQ